MKFDIAVLPGDGIGAEVAPQGVKTLQAVGRRFGHEFVLHYGLVGGAAYDKFGVPLPEETINICKKSHAVLLGAVGGPKWDALPIPLRPEMGLVGLHKKLDLYIDMRPVKIFPSLINASPLKPSVLKGVDLIIVRPLAGPLLFGKPKKTWQTARGRRAIDPLMIREEDARRALLVSFELARSRKQKLTTVIQDQVLESSRLWRDVAIELSSQYPDVKLEQHHTDALGMQLIRNPAELDVIAPDNIIIGGIYNDQAALFMGSMGMAPSAAIRPKKQGSVVTPLGAFGVFGAVHGSSPHRAGQWVANPIANIRTVALLLHYALKLPKEAAAVEKAVNRVLENGYRTYDIMEQGKTKVGTKEMGDLIAKAIETPK